MTTAHIRVNMDNAAFDDDEPGHGCASELARILRRLAEDIESGDLDPMNLRDLNGNGVGRFYVEREE